ncbi:MAG TPA: hypothetical protein VM030_08755 [Acidimicrobiales bacterium]|nr:hypothetical protein [Acidimicrobiales bacterium]
MSEPRRGALRHRAARGVAVAGLVAAGALTTIGCVVALVFERDGFGRPRDAQVRPFYVVLLAVGAAAGVVVPIVVGRMLLGAGRDRLLIALGAAGVLAALILGFVL